MAPSGRRKTRRRLTTSRSSTRKPRTPLKKQLQKSENPEKSSLLPPNNNSPSGKSNISLKKIDEEDNEMSNNNMGCVEDLSSNGCSTPKGKKFRIPRINTCPPAPMKRRSSLVSPSSCSLRRTPIAFFAPQDLELFFFFASDLCVDDAVAS